MPTDLSQILLQRRLSAMGEQAPNPYHDYANEQFQRANGTPKGKGFLGVFPLPHAADPGIASEYSIGDDTAGKDYPTLVPGLTAAELNHLLNTIEQGGGPIQPSVQEKALQHAQSRISHRQSPFAQAGEQDPSILPMFRRIQ